MLKNILKVKIQNVKREWIQMVLTHGKTADIKISPYFFFGLAINFSFGVSFSSLNIDHNNNGIPIAKPIREIICPDVNIPYFSLSILKNSKKNL